MGLSNIYRLCASVFFASSLILSFIFSASVFAAIDKPNYFYDARSKTWIPSTNAVITPQGTIINNSAANQAQRLLDGQGGFVSKSKINANFPTVKKTVPITIDAKTPPSRTKLAAKNLLKGGIAGIILSEGLNQLLDGIGALIDEGGTVVRSTTTMPNNQASHYCVSVPRSSFPLYAPDGTMHTIHDSVGGQPFSCSSAGLTHASYCTSRALGYNTIDGYWPVECRTAPSQPLPPLSPVPASVLDDAVDSSYVPTLDDWDLLAPYMSPDKIEITDLPRLMSPPVTKTIYDSDGNPSSVSETSIWHDFDIRNNDTVQPEIDVKTTEETKVYENGTLTGTTTTTSTATADPEAVPTAGGGGESIDIPTDCDFHPTLCAWMDWTKQNDLDDEPDLKDIMHTFEPDNTDFTVTGAKSCPAPYSIHIALIDKTVELSFEPACTFAGYLYFFVMAGAYVFAAYITLGVARNG